MQEEIDQLNIRVAELEAVIESMRAVTTLPKDISDAFTGRVSQTKLITSAEAAQVVNVPAVGDVAAPMLGFLTTTINGTVYLIPYYN